MTAKASDTNGEGAAIRKLALPQNFVATAATQREQTVVLIAKPRKQAWVSVSPHHEHRVNVAVMELKEENEIYVVAPDMCDELIGEWRPKVLVPYQTRQGSVAYWPIQLPDEDGHHNSWHASSLDIADRYANRWIRVIANREIGGYDVIRPVSEFPPPDWDMDMEKLLDRACHGRVIDSVDHRVVKQLRGIK